MMDESVYLSESLLGTEKAKEKVILNNIFVTNKTNLKITENSLKRTKMGRVNTAVACDNLMK